jgi:hypothetical protein
MRNSGAGSMNLSINYRRENDIGVFYLKGKKNYHDAIEVGVRILQAMEEDDIRALCVYDHSVSDLTTNDVISIEKWLCKVDFPMYKKIAIVNYDVINAGINKFGEAVSSVKGWNIKIFDDEASAKQWLGKPSI